MDTKIVERVFKRYDIRGYYGEEIDEIFSYNLGKSLGMFLKRRNSLPKVVIGGDLREHTPYLKNAFIKGIQSEGVKVIDVGITSTDIVAFASKVFNAFGVEITASHNSFDMNGFKFISPFSTPFTNNDLATLKDIFRKTAHTTPNKIETKNRSSYEVRYAKVYSLYWEKIKKEFFYSLSLRDIVDNAVYFLKNSSLLPFVEYVKDLPISKTTSDLYVLDTSFPSEPTPYVLEDIIEKENLSEDVVFVFDPDADRILIYDKEVGVLEGNRMLASFMLVFPHSTFVTSIDFAEVYYKELNRKGKKILRTAVGDVFVSNKAFELSVQMFGEPNHHVGFGAISYYHSGFATSAFYLSNRLKIIEKYKSLPEVFVITKKMPFSWDYRGIVKRGSVISSVDGVKVKLKDGLYVLIRPSGTENVIKVTVEGICREEVEEIIDKINENSL